MQVNACEVFAKNDLFGTFSEDSKTFEYITYHEFEQRVDCCRTVLRDLGKSWKLLYLTGDGHC